ncbi:hypothetical protein Q0Y17_07485 [Neisseria sp. MVDL20-010259]|nr:hypothetical protein [Neisseria sp. MVDL20-010259]
METESGTKPLSKSVILQQINLISATALRLSSKRTILSTAKAATESAVLLVPSAACSLVSKMSLFAIYYCLRYQTEQFETDTAAVVKPIFRINAEPILLPLRQFAKPLF